MGKVKTWDAFNKVSEDEDNESEFQNRLYGTGENSKRDLIKLLEALISDISKFNPNSQEEYDTIKNDIQSKKNSIIRHHDFEEFKKFGFEWQDSVVKLSDWESELKKAALSLYNKAVKKGFK